MYAEFDLERPASLPELFGIVGAVGIGGGLLMLIVASPIRRLMGQVN